MPSLDGLVVAGETEGAVMSGVDVTGPGDACAGCSTDRGATSAIGGGAGTVCALTSLNGVLVSVAVALMCPGAIRACGGGSGTFCPSCSSVGGVLELDDFFGCLLLIVVSLNNIT